MYAWKHYNYFKFEKIYKHFRNQPWCFCLSQEYSTQVFRRINHFSRLIFLSLLFAADEGIIIKTETLDFLLRTHSLEHWAWICSETPWNQFSIEETPPIYKVITNSLKEKGEKNENGAVPSCRQFGVSPCSLAGWHTNQVLTWHR